MDIRIALLAPTADSPPFPASGSAGQEAEFALLMMSGGPTAAADAPAPIATAIAAIQEDDTAQPSDAEAEVCPAEETMDFLSLPAQVPIADGTHSGTFPTADMTSLPSELAFSADVAMQTNAMLASPFTPPPADPELSSDDGLAPNTDVFDAANSDHSMINASDGRAGPLIVPTQTSTPGPDSEPYGLSVEPLQAPAQPANFYRTDWRLDGIQDAAWTDMPQPSHNMAPAEMAGKTLSQSAATGGISGLGILDGIPNLVGQESDLGPPTLAKQAIPTADPLTTTPVWQSTGGSQSQRHNLPHAALKHEGSSAALITPTGKVGSPPETKGAEVYLPYGAMTDAMPAQLAPEPKPGTAAKQPASPAPLHPIAASPQPVSIRGNQQNLAVLHPIAALPQPEAGRRWGYSVESSMGGTIEVRPREERVNIANGGSPSPMNTPQAAVPTFMTRIGPMPDVHIASAIKEELIRDEAHGEDAAVNGTSWHPASTLGERPSLAPAAGGHPTRQVADAIIRTAAPQSETELVLTPEELGTVRFTVTQQDGVIAIAISADRPDTLALLRRNADMLSADLAQSGMGDATLNFGASGHDRQRNDERQPWNASPKSGAIEIASDRPRIQPTQRATTSGRLDIRL